ncbi:MAG: hydroxysqualene dehydroxylase HpnE [Mycobacteriales bacterium]
MTGPVVCVVGGGLAGLSAALTAADGGAVVTLLEARPRLGGATFSFERDGLPIDNGQHVFLRCCTAYQDFLRRVGSQDRVQMQDRLRIAVVSPGGRIATIGRSGAPSPLHLAATIARYPLLSGWEKAAAGRAVAALRRLDPDDPRLDAESLGHWLGRHGQSDRAIDALWGLISVATTNVLPDETSMRLGATVLRTGLLERADAADIGVPAVPLSRLHADPAATALTEIGATVHTGTRVTGVRREGGRLRVEVAGAAFLAADAVIVAVPHDRVEAVLPPGTITGPSPAGLGFSPIVNLHVLYDRRVTDLAFAAGHDSPVQWVFDRTASAGVTDGQYLTVSLSAAETYLNEPVASLRGTFVPALADLFPAARSAVLRRFLVTREPHATFRGAPSTANLRSGECTDTPGVFVAGSWTDTGWPATMEGAVRSGVRAARRALASVHLRADRDHLGVDHLDDRRDLVTGSDVVTPPTSPPARLPAEARITP